MTASNESRYFKLGLLGHPVKHSLSPELHEAALRHHDLAGEYNLFDVEPHQLKTFFESAKENGMHGVNVTIPHKEAVLPFLDSLSREASRVGAVNTIVFDADGAIGYNTDVFGFKNGLERAIRWTYSSLDQYRNGSALVLGCGGAARAVIVGLIDLGFEKIVVHGRNPDRVRSFIHSMQQVIDASEKKTLVEPASGELCGTDTSLLVNATPIGQREDALPEWVLTLIKKLPHSCFVYDLVYANDRKQTPIVDLALKRKMMAGSGAGMLISQATMAFELWTGLPVPFEIMASSLNCEPRRT